MKELLKTNNSNNNKEPVRRKSNFLMSYNQQKLVEDNVKRNRVYNKNVVVSNRTETFIQNY